VNEMDEELARALEVLKRFGKEYAFFEKHYLPEVPKDAPVIHGLYHFKQYWIKVKDEAIMFKKMWFKTSKQGWAFYTGGTKMVPIAVEWWSPLK